MDRVPNEEFYLFFFLFFFVDTFSRPSADVTEIKNNHLARFKFTIHLLQERHIKVQTLSLENRGGGGGANEKKFYTTKMT